MKGDKTMKSEAFESESPSNNHVHSDDFRRNLMNRTTRLVNRLLAVLHEDLNSEEAGGVENCQMQRIIGQASALAALSQVAWGKIPDECHGVVEEDAGDVLYSFHQMSRPVPARLN